MRSERTCVAGQCSSTCFLGSPFPPCPGFVIRHPVTGPCRPDGGRSCAAPRRVRFDRPLFDALAVFARGCLWTRFVFVEAAPLSAQLRPGGGDVCQHKHSAIRLGSVPIVLFLVFLGFLETYCVFLVCLWFLETYCICHHWESLEPFFFHLFLVYFLFSLILSSL